MTNPSAKPTSKRRWLQYSLRSGFIVVTALCVALSLWIVPLERKRRAVLAIEAMGGTVSYHELDGAIGYLDPSEPSPMPFLRRWLPQVYFDDIIVVNLADTPITDAGLAYLQVLTSLQVLDLSDTQVTDAGLAHLEGLTSLRCLFLNASQVTDAGLVRLRGLASLERLWLEDTEVADAGLAHLQSLARLQQLYLSNTQVTDAGLVHLEGLRSLRCLYLGGTHLTDAGLVQLREALPACFIREP